jgi:hypothetical protein
MVTKYHCDPLLPVTNKTVAFYLEITALLKEIRNNEFYGVQNDLMLILAQTFPNKNIFQILMKIVKNLHTL